MTIDARVPDQAAALPDGGAMPLLGFGTWQIRGADASKAVGWALDAGYRHLDTATVYGNEAEVGAALRESGLDRDEVFVTTKMPGGGTGQESATLDQSLQKLGTDHVDLWLIHWPTDGAANVPMWQALIDANRQGLARAIGVSNYSLAMIDELVSATGVTPAVNQIEWSPLLFDQSIVDGHRERNVVVEGYSALRGGTLEHPAILEIAQRQGRSTAQVIIRWHLQHGVVAIPKSTNPDRIRSNADLAGFELSADDMAALDGLGTA